MPAEEEEAPTGEEEQEEGQLAEEVLGQPAGPTIRPDAVLGRTILQRKQEPTPTARFSIGRKTIVFPLTILIDSKRTLSAAGAASPSPFAIIGGAGRDPSQRSALLGNYQKVRIGGLFAINDE